MTWHRRIALSASIIAFAAAHVGAQPTAGATGRVLNDVDDKPLGGAEVSMPGLGLRSTSDSSGAFRLGGVPAGKQIVWVRKIGFNPISAVLTFVAEETLECDFILLPATTRLPGVEVKGVAPVSPKLSEFEERRKEGFGHFLTASQLEKMEGRRMAEIMATIPGPRILRGTTNAAWVVGGRGPVSVTRNGGALNAMDVARGAKRGLCYSAVILDGIFVYQGHDGESLFDINSIQPAEIAGLEVYTSTATIPPKYNGTRATCGLVVVWTK
ncbi:MAG TPA: carboxypeptidase regulatory-like domain-containing protein [Gemmatimonadaceae bacterium]|nr:carboxypeptidase regulatory-like domain-containing protein [Gemmatimonadaceae bacterium]